MYLTHEPDEETPIAETLRALDEVVRAGKARAIGASNLDGAGLEQALETSDGSGSRASAGCRTSTACCVASVEGESFRSASGRASASRRSARSPAGG